MISEDYPPDEPYDGDGDWFFDMAAEDADPGNFGGSGRPKGTRKYAESDSDSEDSEAGDKEGLTKEERNNLA